MEFVSLSLQEINLLIENLENGYIEVSLDFLRVLQSHMNAQLKQKRMAENRKDFYWGTGERGSEIG